MGINAEFNFPMKALEMSFPYVINAPLFICLFVCLFITVMILSFRTDLPGQTVQTQIRLLLEEKQSDQGLHCLPFRLHRLDSLLYGKAT